MRQLSLLGPVMAGLLFCASAYAADPASQQVQIPDRPGTYTFRWAGVAPAGVIANVGNNTGTGACATDVTDITNDVETFTVAVPDGLYQKYVVKAQFHIEWQQTGTLPANPVFSEDALPDLAMSLLFGSALVTSSDGGTPSENIATQDPVAGDYSVLVCSAIASSDTAYTGTLTVTVAPASGVAASAPASADPRGLEFSASLVDELQYFEGEPLVTVDNDGTIYTCGPAGSAYPMADYAQASLDGGDQFNRLGDPTTGRMGLMGGGDCAMATGLDKNAQGNYQLAYAGLSNLLQFTVSTSPDKGQTLTNVPFSSTAPVADRQWLAFTDAMNVFLVYKNEQSLGVVHQSTDGGLTYSPPVPVAPFPSIVGAIHSMTKDENPAHNGKAALYFPWTAGTTVALALSQDAGSTWNICTVTTSQGDPSNLFPAADHDTQGNLYVAYTDQADYNTYLVTVPAAELANCTGGSGPTGSLSPKLKTLPAVQMNRDDAVSSVMPWVAAGGLPGRVAVSFYGSPVKGAVDDATLPHVWNVYVSQTLDALDASPSVAQVKVSTHPMHYDQICTGGVGCTSGGDRSLSDFFSIAYNKANGELDVVFNRSGKKPGDGSSSSGPITATSFARQIDGPSNGGGTVARNGRQVLRQSSADPTGDAYGGFSGLVAPTTRTQLAALDLTSVSVDPARDVKTRQALEGGGFTVTMRVKDLSDAALADALSRTGGQSLVWMFYYWDGYTPHAAAATWDGSSFSFGTSGATEAGNCATPPEATVFIGCDEYTLATPLDGQVDQAAGTIAITLPLSMLTSLANVPPPARSPAQVAARAGDRIYSAAAYTFVNLTGASQDVSQSLLPVDNTAAMDFVIPPGLSALAESACAAPGITVATSPPGTSSAGLPTGQDDLRSVAFAEPADQPGKLIVTIKMDNLDPQPPPGYRWLVYLTLPGSTDQYWVGMSTVSDAAPSFAYGTRGTIDVPAASVGSYTTLGALEGSWNPDGTIQVVIDTDTAPFALKAGDVISGISAAIRRSSPDVTNNIGLTVDSADGVNYTVVKNHCGAAVGRAGESRGTVLGGGALGFLTLLPLAGAALLRRRRR